MGGGGAGGPDPPLKITSYIFIGISNWTPPLEKSCTFLEPWKIIDFLELNNWTPSVK